MNRLDELRRLCAEPLPGAAALRADGELILDWLLRHHATLPEQHVGRPASRADMEAVLGAPFPETGQPLTEVLADFADKVAPFACRINHPRFLAFIPSAPTFVSVLGDFLAAGVNYFAGVWLEAAGPAQVELAVLDWFRDVLGLPPGTSGVLTGGGSEANLTALVVAREPLSEDERRRAVLYVTDQRHWSVDRAAKVMGLRADQVRPVHAGADFRLDVAALRSAVSADRAAGRRPWALVANAGATNTGTVDPLAEIADVCAAEGLWLHVDGAYGWAAALTDAGRRELAGIERADSVTLDPHKWLAQPFECGCVLVREGVRLAKTFALRPDYLQDVTPDEAGEVNFADHGIALTRRFRALKVWLSLRVLGVGWYRRLIERCVRLADLAEALLREAGFQVLSPRRLSVVCYRHVPASLAGDEAALDRHNLALVDAVRATGRAFLSSTRLSGRVALRFCFVNWRTTTADVEEVVRLLGETGATV